VDRRIAQGPPPSGRPESGAAGEEDDPRASAGAGGRVTGRGAPSAVFVGLAIVAVMLVVYVFCNPLRTNFYNHFVWQASAWLEGQGTIRYPVPPTAVSPGNDYFQDVLPVVDEAGRPSGRGIMPFPPLPAVLLVPFVAIWGLSSNAQLVAAVLGALDVGLAFWMLGRLGVTTPIQVAVTFFFGLGTVFWYASEEGTTWFFAHLVAVPLTMAAVAIALGRDRAAARGALRATEAGESASPADNDAADDDEADDDEADDDEAIRDDAPLGPRAMIDGHQFLAGLLFGLACAARLTVVFGAPFFLLVGGGGGWLRRGLSAGLGAALPLAGLLAYNLAATGNVFNPAYDYLYRAETASYTFLDYRPDWSIEDPRYIPRNLVLMLIGPPLVNPATLDFGEPLCTADGASRGWFNPDCPILMPNSVGMGLLLTSPAYLLALPALRRYGRSRLVTGAALAILFIAVINLMHFSQGWVQFGYRFSLDFAPFLLLSMAVGIHQAGGLGRPAKALILASIAIQAWGVWWGAALGW
jgi:hypothetical protein